MSTLSVTATISFDRNTLMQNMSKPSDTAQMPEEPPETGFDKSQFSDVMGQSSSLTLEEYQTYAAANSVENFYYTLTASLNGSEDFEPVSSTQTTQSADDTQTASAPNTNNMIGGGSFGGGKERQMGAQSDFSLEGVSSESAMTSFLSGTSTITSGSIFEEGTESYECIISEELATFNNLSVSDTITFTNPNNEQETYTFTIVGIYADTSANENSFSIMGATSMDPANKIYTSYAALQNLIETSESVSETQTDETTDMEFQTAVTGTLSGTYVFASTDDYYQFEEEVRELGLDESYTVSSTDITAFENSLVPLNTLSTMAGYFLLVILLIGAIILIVLNIFNVRERKYEIGVLTAMGMKKGKVALQFLTEIFVVTLSAVIIGLAVCAVSSVPITNALLENQVAAQRIQVNQTEQNFGRGEKNQGMVENNPDQNAFNLPGNGFESAGEYITQIHSAMNLTVVVQMLAIGILLTLIAGAASMLFVMRYEPLKILANKD